MMRTAIANRFRPRSLGTWVLICAVGVNLLVLTVAVTWTAGIDRATGGIIPRHYIGQFDAAPLDSYGNTLGMAHNSGDSLDKINNAVDAGAHGIEIDVISYQGDLYARHNQPLAVLGEFGFRPVPLTEAWKAAESEIVQLDLKDTSSVLLSQVTRFLGEHRDGRIVLISSWDADVLRFLEEETPWVGRLLSVGDQAAYDRLMTTQSSLLDSELIDGLTIQHDVLDQQTVAVLKQHDLLIFAWVVESLSRVNELSLFGVDAIVTDNLAILNLLDESLEDGVMNPPDSSASPTPQE